MIGDIIAFAILAALGISLIYLIIKRTQDSKKENFEKRDN